MKMFILLGAMFFSMAGFSCTTFFIHRGNEMVFGRNYDWMADAGIVCSNLRGLYKTSAPTKDGKTISWTSRYGSITFNQYGKEFPTGGMNEKGLVVELMWLDGTQYPKPDERPSIGVLQWIQYQLDNATSIDDVIASDKILRITSEGTPLHYLIADASGKSAAIEFLDGKMVVHKDLDLPVSVLTNDKYATSLWAKQNSNTNGNNSLERFSTACSMVEKVNSLPGDRSVIDYSFEILNNVAQGDFTKWSIVYDLKKKQIHFKTERETTIKLIDFTNTNFDCRSVSKAIDVNTKLNGDVTAKMTVYTPEMNRKTVELSATQSQSRIKATTAQKEEIIAYPGSIVCGN